MSDTAVIDQGREAWKRIRSQERLSWSDWIVVGKALLVGRAICMKAAQVNEPRGGRYNYVANTWLRENGFDDISAQERHRACRIIENLDEVTRWRNSLPPEKKRNTNHPSHWASFVAFKRGRERQQRHPRPASSTVPIARGRPVYWPQECIRRAAVAMRESGSRDWFQLARVALEHSVTNDMELLALLDARLTRPIRQPRQAALVASPA